MTPADAHKAILQTWITGWATRAPTVPYAIDNRTLAQPTPPFAIVEIVNLAGDQVTMGPPGARRFERSGLIEVRLYDARGNGRGPTDVLAQYVKEIFESKRLGATGTDHGVITYAMDAREIRDDREYPDLWCMLCRIGFEYHERR